MICKLSGRANKLNLLNLFFIAAVLGLFSLGCTKTKDVSETKTKEVSESGSSVELREAEYKTVKHPVMKYYATIQPDGLQVSLRTAEGNVGFYTFPHKAFSLGEPVFLLCPGSPDLLPMRVVLVRGANNDLNAYHDYKIEWLDKAPAASDGVRIVRSY